MTGPGEDIVAALRGLTHVAAVDLSADGGVALVVRARVDLRADRVATQILVGATPGPLADIGPGERRGVRLSPAGDRIAYVRDGQLHVERPGRRPRRLTVVPDGIAAFAWRPDGAGLVAVAGERRPGPDHAPWSDAEGRASDGRPGPTVTGRLLVVGLDGASDELTAGHDDRAPAVSPDCSWVAFARLARDPRGRETAELWRVPLAGGAAQSLRTGLDLAVSPSWSPTGEHLACYGSREPRLGPSDPGMRLWTLPAAGGAASAVAPEDDRSVALLPRLPAAASGPAWLPDGELLYAVLHAGAVELVAAGDGGSVRTVRGGERQVLGFAVGGGRLLVREATPDEPGRAVLAPLRGGRNRILVRGRTARLPLRTERRRIAGHDAWLTRRSDAAGPAPLLVALHGGPQGFHGPGFPGGHLYRRVLAGRGWLVLALNSTGSGSYTTAFADAILGRWGEADLPEHLAAVDELVASGEADPRRLAVAGFSYGGFLATWAIAHDERFRAAVVGAPVADLATMRSTSDIGRWFVPLQLGAEPWEDPDLYRRLSPVTHAGRATAPTLLLCGDRDERCPLGQAQALRDALGGPCELVRYPGADHLFMSSGRPSHRLDANRRIVDWLERWVASPAS